MSAKVQNCPCCGAPLPKVVPLDVIPVDARLTPMQTTLFRVVSGERGQWVRPDRIIKEVWGGQVDGGPLDPHLQLRNIYRRLRTKLRGTGVDILRGGQSGGMPGWFRVIYVDAKGNEVAA